MRKVLVIFGVLLSLVFVGCATTKPAYHSKMPQDSVYIDPYHSWANQCPVKSFPSYGKCNSPWRSITLRVINTKYRDVRVTVKCFYDQKVPFGEPQTRVVKKRDDKTFLVWGLARLVPDNETVQCRITDVK